MHPHCHLFHSGTRTHTAASSMKHPHPHCLFYSSTHIHSATSSIQAHTCRMLAHTHTHTHTYTTTHTDVQCNVTFTTDDFRHRCTLTWMLNSTMYIKISSMALKALFSNQTRTDIFACVRSSHMHTMPDASTATRAGHAGHTNNHTSTHHVQRINNHTSTHHAGHTHSHTCRSCWTHQQPHKHTMFNASTTSHAHTMSGTAACCSRPMMRSAYIWISKLLRLSSSFSTGSILVRHLHTICIDDLFYIVFFCTEKLWRRQTFGAGACWTHLGLPLVVHSEK